jgi:hypothetical protein
VAGRAKLTSALAAVCALGLVLTACSLAGPNPHTFTPEAESKRTKPDARAIEQASKICKDQTREKGIKSVLAIVTRMRPGAVDEDYIECMKQKGYTVEN